MKRLAGLVVVSLVVPVGLARAGGPKKGETITVSYHGSVAANGDSYGAAISRNGRFVAFVSNATNLSEPPGNGMGQAMVFDRKRGTIELVSQLGGFPADQDCNRAAISSNGRFAVFSTKAMNLVPGANGKLQVYRVDRKAHTIARVSQSATGVAADQDAFSSARGVSTNGRFVVFTSAATNLTTAGGNGKFQAYRRDMNGGATDLISATPAGAVGAGDVSEARITDDGKLVVFDSPANDLTADDQNPARDISLRNVEQNVTTLVSRAQNGAAANSACSRGVISGARPDLRQREVRDVPVAVREPRRRPEHADRRLPAPAVTGRRRAVQFMRCTNTSPVSFVSPASSRSAAFEVKITNFPFAEIAG